MTITPVSPGIIRSLWVALACITTSTGCTSVISSAYLREAWLDAVEHAAETRADAKHGKKSAASGKADADGAEDADDTSTDGDTSAASMEPAAESVAPPFATIDEAVADAERRLATSGGLNGAARGTLIATLKSTPRQDWAVVVEEFSAALAAAQGDGGAAPARTPQATVTSASGPSETLAATNTAKEDTAPAADADPVAPMPPAEASQDAVPAAVQQPAPAAPPHAAFAVQNACFASRVRAWGVVDRFETAQFQPGQELIVYFELDQLASRESAEGHTTRIDTVLKLVDAGGRRVHEWTFEPLEETCGGHRRDYFARYLVALPASMPAGSCRLEVVVTDAIAGRTAQTSLPLDVVAP